MIIMVMITIKNNKLHFNNFITQIHIFYFRGYKNVKLYSSFSETNEEKIIINRFKNMISKRIFNNFNWLKID